MTHENCMWRPLNMVLMCGVCIEPYCRSEPKQRTINFAHQVKDFFRTLGKAHDQSEVDNFVREHCNPLAVSDPIARKLESKEKLGEYKPDWFQKVCTLDVICDGERPTSFCGGCWRVSCLFSRRQSIIYLGFGET